MRTAACAFAFCAIAATAAAMDDLEAITIAGSLGSVIAAENACGLTFDQSAISAYITETVPPDRMDFASLLQTQVLGQEAMLTDMTESGLTAHCTAITQSARHFGFIAD